MLAPNGQVRAMEQGLAQRYVDSSKTHGMPAVILNKVEDRQTTADQPVPPKAAAPLAPQPTYGRQTPRLASTPSTTSEVDVLMSTGQVRVMEEGLAQQYVANNQAHGRPARILNGVNDRQRVIDQQVPAKALAPAWRTIPQQSKFQQVQV